jgi:hypothetical protein
MEGARREAVPGPDGYSGCGLEQPEWTKPVMQIKDSLEEHRDYRIRQLLIRFNNPTGLVGLLETIATVFTDLTDRVDVLEMELNRLKRAKG